VPTYEYKCSSCDYSYETREGFDAPSRQACPRCGALAKRVLFPPPIVFKGSGFYVTDSRKGSSHTIGADNGGTGAATPETKPSSDGAAESKPAATATSSDAAAAG
jgi:putative FmdB family regulatory protein